MKRLIATVLALGLSACASFNPLASVSNPVTPAMLYQVENGAIIIFAGLKAYKSTCQTGTIPQSCRQVVAQIQAVSRKLPPLIRNLRTFVRNNDQVNAAVVYNTVIQTVADMKAIATANNIAIGGQ